MNYLIPFVIFFLILSLFTALRLFLLLRQLADLIRQLQNLPPDSNRRLTCFLHSKTILTLCREINRILDESDAHILQARDIQRELQYTITCVSHDIRTPLTGAAGYLQLLSQNPNPEKQNRYCRIIRQKLTDLEQLLDELFLYTRLTGNMLTLTPAPVQLYPAVCDALAGYYEQLTAQSLEPVLSFENEAVQITADPAQLRRILRNLISNALSHGCGPLSILQTESTLSFVNKVKAPQSLHPERMFERFYRDDLSRQGTHAGLGLSIASELMARMGGSIQASLTEDTLTITLRFQQIC